MSRRRRRSNQPRRTENGSAADRATRRGRRRQRFRLRPWRRWLAAIPALPPVPVRAGGPCGPLSSGPRIIGWRPAPKRTRRPRRNRSTANLLVVAFGHEPRRGDAANGHGGSAAEPAGRPPIAPVPDARRWIFPAFLLGDCGRCRRFPGHRRRSPSTLRRPACRFAAAVGQSRRRWPAECPARSSPSQRGGSCPLRIEVRRSTGPRLAHARGREAAALLDPAPWPTEGMYRAIPSENSGPHATRRVRLCLGANVGGLLRESGPGQPRASLARWTSGHRLKNPQRGCRRKVGGKARRYTGWRRERSGGVEGEGGAGSGGASPLRPAESRRMAPLRHVRGGVPPYATSLRIPRSDRRAGGCPWRGDRPWASRRDRRSQTVSRRTRRPGPARHACGRRPAPQELWSGQEHPPPSAVRSGNAIGGDHMDRSGAAPAGRPGMPTGPGMAASGSRCSRTSESSAFPVQDLFLLRLVNPTHQTSVLQDTPSV